MKSRVVKHSIFIAGRKSSISLEDEFWGALKEIAAGRHLPLTALVHEIDTQRHGNLSSALRLFVLDYYRSQAAAKRGGDMQNGHPVPSPAAPS
jgi:predicted DNA-binding ribbon-helix-helix protein